MDRRNLISVTLLVTALAFNPLLAQHTIQMTQLVKENRVSSNIANLLHKRGLDEEAAKELAETLFEEDEELFALMLNNLLYGCDSLDKDQVLEYLSSAALHRQNVHLDSYAHLVSMVSKIKQSVLDENTLEQLSKVAKSNSYFVRHFRQVQKKQA